MTPAVGVEVGSIERALKALEALDPSAPALEQARREVAVLRLLREHPHREAILREMLRDPARQWSPLRLSEALNLPLGTTAYHVRVLADRGTIRLVDTAQRRGAQEHFYAIATSRRQRR